MAEWQFGYLSKETKEIQNETFKFNRFTLDSEFINAVKDYFKTTYLVTSRHKEPYPPEAINQIWNAVLNLLKQGARCFDVKIENFTCEYLENFGGGYDKSINSLLINEKVLTNPWLMHIILHELRHAEQHQILVNQKTEFSKSLSLAFENYVNFSEDGLSRIIYNTNLLEYDAEQFSSKLSEQLFTLVLISIKNEPKEYVQFVEEVVDNNCLRQIENNDEDLRCMRDAKEIDKIVIELKDWKEKYINDFYKKTPEEIDEFLSNPQNKTLLDEIIAKFNKILKVENPPSVVSTSELKDYIFNILYGEINLKDFILTCKIDPNLNGIVLTRGFNQIKRAQLLPDNIQKFLSLSKRSRLFDKDKNLSITEIINEYVEISINRLLCYLSSEYYDDMEKIKSVLFDCSELLGSNKVSEIFIKKAGNKTISIHCSNFIKKDIVNLLKEYNIYNKCNFEFFEYENLEDYVTQNKPSIDDLNNSI